MVICFRCISSLVEENNNLRVFTVDELKAATDNFYGGSKIGEGGFGSVYKGVIKSFKHPFHEIQVAVKMANELLQGHREWVREINDFGMVEHPNLVKLIGYCAEENKRKDGTQVYFVYEYMANGSVRDHLSAKSETPIPWDRRLKVAQDVARVLMYLHEKIEYQMIFLNFKSNNVLLDDKWNAKLSDFGVAQILGPDEKTVTHISTKTTATIHVGYAAPEYIATRHLTPKVDVLSYGVFLYELITSRYPFDSNLSNDNQSLVEWVKPYLGSKRFKEIIDPRLEGNYSLSSAQKLSDLANKCLSENPKSRPKMSEALEMVDQLITVPSQATSSASPQVPQVAVDPVGPVKNGTRI